jgi:uncharacterized protein
MATALELRRKGWQPYLKGAGLRSKQPVSVLQVEKVRERLLALARSAADMLKCRYGVHRVILIGSLVREESFYAHSDVDLAVEGLSGDDYWEAWAKVEEIIVDRPVDLIEMESAGDSLRRSILRYGMEL